MIIDENDYENVVCYFINNIDNRSRIIAKMLNLRINYVDEILDIYLSKKANYMGNYFKEPLKRSGKSIPIKVYENEDLIGTFEYIIDAANFIGLKYSSIISNRLINENKCTIYHKKLKKTYTYEKI